MPIGDMSFSAEYSAVAYAPYQTHDGSLRDQCCLRIVLSFEPTSDSPFPSVHSKITA